MLQLIIGLLLMTQMTASAAQITSKENQKKADEYDNHITAFENNSPYKITIHIERPILENVREDEYYQKVTFEADEDLYRKITVNTLKNGNLDKIERFYFSPQGKMIVSEADFPKKERLRFYYYEDNPIKYRKFEWNSSVSEYQEKFYNTIKKNVRDNALILLENGMNYYDACIEFLDNLPE
jgi:hypothetical protein